MSKDKFPEGLTKNELERIAHEAELAKKVDQLKADAEAALDQDWSQD